MEWKSISENINGIIWDSSQEICLFSPIHLYYEYFIYIHIALWTFIWCFGLESNST